MLLYKITFIFVLFTLIFRYFLKSYYKNFPSEYRRAVYNDKFDILMVSGLCTIISTILVFISVAHFIWQI